MLQLVLCQMSTRPDKCRAKRLCPAPSSRTTTSKAPRKWGRCCIRKLGHAQAAAFPNCPVEGHSVTFDPYTCRGAKPERGPFRSRNIGSSPKAAWAGLGGLNACLKSPRNNPKLEIPRVALIRQFDALFLGAFEEVAQPGNCTPSIDQKAVLPRSHWG